MMKSKRGKIGIAIVAAVLIVTSVIYDIAWAYPEQFIRSRDSLATPNFFKEDSCKETAHCEYLLQLLTHSGVPAAGLHLRDVKKFIQSHQEESWFKDYFSPQELDGEVRLHIARYTLCFYVPSSNRKLPAGYESRKVVSLNEKLLHVELIFRKEARPPSADAAPQEPVGRRNRMKRIFENPLMQQILEQCYQDEEERRQARTSLKRFLQTPYWHKEGVFSAVDIMSDEEKLREARTALKMEGYSFLFGQSFSLGVITSLETDSSKHVIRSIIDLYMMDFKKSGLRLILKWLLAMISGNVESYVRSIMQWKRFYLLLSVIEITSRNKALVESSDASARLSEPRDDAWRIPPVPTADTYDPDAFARLIESNYKNPGPRIDNILVIYSKLPKKTQDHVLARLTETARTYVLGRTQNTVQGNLIGKLFADKECTVQVTWNICAKEEGKYLVFYDGHGAILYTKNGKPARVKMAANSITTPAGYTIHTLEDNPFIQGFAGQNHYYVTSTYADNPIVVYHEIGEAAYNANQQILPINVNAHTYLRGCGMDVRILIKEALLQKELMPDFSAEEAVAYITKKLPPRRFSEAEIWLMRNNAAKNVRGLELLYGEQDRKFGPYANELLSRSIEGSLVNEAWYVLDDSMMALVKKTMQRYPSAFSQDWASAESLLKSRFKEFQDLTFYGHQPQEASHYWSEYKAWHDAFMSAVAGQAAQAISADKKMAKLLAALEARHFYAIAKLNWTWTWRMELLWGKIEELQEKIRVSSGDEKKAFERHAKGLASAMVEQHEKFMAEYPYPEFIENDKAVKEAMKVVDVVARSQTSKIGPAMSGMPPISAYLNKKAQIAGTTIQRVAVACKSFAQKISWKKALYIYGGAIGLSLILAAVLPVNAITISISIIAPLVLLVYILAKGNWTWGGLLFFLGTSIILSFFLPIPWLGLSLTAIILGDMMLNKKKAALTGPSAGQPQASAPASQPKAEQEQPAKTDSANEPKKTPEAGTAETQKPPEFEAKPAEKQLSAITIDPEVLKYMTQLIGSYTQGKDAAEEPFAITNEAIITGIFRLEGLENTKIDMAQKERLRQPVWTELKKIEEGFSFDLIKDIKTLKEWRSRKESDLESLALSLHSLSQEISQELRAHYSVPESDSDMIIIQQLIAEYPISKKPASKIHTNTLISDKAVFNEIQTYLALVILRDTILSKKWDKKADSFYTLGVLEFRFRHYEKSEEAFLEAATLNPSHPDYLFALALTKHYQNTPEKIKEARQWYELSLKLQETKSEQSRTDADKLKVTLTRLLIDKCKNGHPLTNFLKHEGDSATVGQPGPTDMSLLGAKIAADSSSDGDTSNPFIVWHIDDGKAFEVNENKEAAFQIKFDRSNPRAPPMEDLWRSNGTFEKIKKAKDPAVLAGILRSKKNFRNIQPEEYDTLIKIIQDISLSVIIGHALIGARGDDWIYTHVRTGRRKEKHGLEPTIWIGELLLDQLTHEELAQLLVEESHHVMRPPEYVDGQWIHRHGRISDSAIPSHVIEHDEAFFDILEARASAAIALQRRPNILKEPFMLPDTSSAEQSVSHSNGQAKEPPFFSKPVEVLIRELQEDRDNIAANESLLPAAATIFGSARIREDNPTYVLSKAIGDMVRMYGLPIRTGAGWSMMKGPAEGYIAARERLGLARSTANDVQGVKILLKGETDVNGLIENYYIVRHLAMRKLGLYLNSKGCIVMPGGYGTLDELFEVWSCGIPLVLVDKSYWRPLFAALFLSWNDAGFMLDKIKHIPDLVDGPEDALGRITGVSHKEQRQTPLYVQMANREIEEGLRTLSRWQPSVTIFGESHTGMSEFEAARVLADKLIERGIPVRSASRGEVTKLVADSAIRNKRPDLAQASLFVPEGQNLSDDERSIASRITTMDIANYHVMTVENSRALVFLPGAITTMNSLFDALAAQQTGIVPAKRIILVGRTFWQPIKEAIGVMIRKYEPNLIDYPKDLDLMEIVDTADEAIALLEKSSAGAAAVSQTRTTAGNEQGKVLHPDLGPKEAGEAAAAFAPTASPAANMDDKAYIIVLREFALKRGTTPVQILALDGGPDSHGGIEPLVEAKKHLPKYGCILIDRAIDLYENRFRRTLLGIIYSFHEINNIICAMAWNYNEIPNDEKISDEKSALIVSKELQPFLVAWREFSQVIDQARNIDLGKEMVIADRSWLQCRWYDALVALKKGVDERAAGVAKVALYNGHAAERLEVAFKRLDDILNVFMAYIDTGDLSLQLKKINANQFVRQNISNKEYSDPSVKLSFSYPGNDGDIETDPRLLELILSNLKRNAVEAMVGQRVEEGKDRELISTVETNEYFTTITIADNGPGISPEDLPHIFELFWTKGKDKGTGVGLSLVKEAVARLSGTIEVTSEIGKGTAFTIRLPNKVQGLLGEPYKNSVVLPKLRSANDLYPIPVGDIITLPEGVESSIYITARFDKTVILPDGEMWAKEKDSEVWRPVPMTIGLNDRWGNTFRFEAKVPPQAEKLTFLFYADNPSRPTWWNDVGGRDLLIKRVKAEPANMARKAPMSLGKKLAIAGAVVFGITFAGVVTLNAGLMLGAVAIGCTMLFLVSVYIYARVLAIAKDIESKISLYNDLTKQKADAEVPRGVSNIVAMEPLAQKPVWRLLKLFIETSEAENAVKGKSGLQLRNTCERWSKMLTLDLAEKEYMVREAKTAVFSLRGKSKDGKPKDKDVANHFWVEIKLHNDDRTYVLDRTIGQFADVRILDLLGGLDKLHEVLNPYFLAKNNIRNEVELANKLMEFERAGGFFGLKDDYPFSADNEPDAEETVFGPTDIAQKAPYIAQTTGENKTVMGSRDAVNEAILDAYSSYKANAIPIETAASLVLNALTETPDVDAKVQPFEIGLAMEILKESAEKYATMKPMVDVLEGYGHWSLDRFIVNSDRTGLRTKMRQALELSEGSASAGQPGPTDMAGKAPDNLDPSGMNSPRYIDSTHAEDIGKIVKQMLNSMRPHKEAILKLLEHPEPGSEAVIRKEFSGIVEAHYEFMSFCSLNTANIRIQKIGDDICDTLGNNMDAVAIRLQNGKGIADELMQLFKSLDALEAIVNVGKIYEIAKFRVYDSKKGTAYFVRPDSAIPAPTQPGPTDMARERLANAWLASLAEDWKFEEGPFGSMLAKFELHQGKDVVAAATMLISPEGISIRTCGIFRNSGISTSKYGKLQLLRRSFARGKEIAHLMGFEPKWAFVHAVGDWSEFGRDVKGVYAAMAHMKFISHKDTSDAAMKYRQDPELKKLIAQTVDERYTETYHYWFRPLDDFVDVSGRKLSEAGYAFNDKKAVDQIRAALRSMWPKPSFIKDMPLETEELIEALGQLTIVQMKDRPLPAGSRILLSSTLFDGLKDEDRDNLERLFKGTCVEIADLRELRKRAINTKMTKDKLAIVMTREDFDNKDVWNGSDKEVAVRSSVLILDGKLIGPNYLYIDGVIGLALALMRQDKDAVKRYYRLISGVVLDEEVIGLLKKDGFNTIAFALRAILKFKPIEVNSSDELERYKKIMENYLVQA